MAHESSQCWFLFPAMPLEDRQLILNLGEFLVATDGHYRKHLTTELQLLYDAERTADRRQESPRGLSRIIPFPVRRF